MEPEVFWVGRNVTTGPSDTLTFQQRLEIMAALGHTYAYATQEQLVAAYEQNANWCVFGVTEWELHGLRNVVSHFNTATSCNGGTRIVPKFGVGVGPASSSQVLSGLHVFGIKPSPNRPIAPTSSISTRMGSNDSVALDVFGRGKFEYIIRPWNSETKQYFQHLDDIVPFGVTVASRDEYLATSLFILYVGLVSFMLFCYHAWHRHKHQSSYNALTSSLRAPIMYLN
jgi:hypothetical protein